MNFKIILSITLLFGLDRSLLCATPNIDSLVQESLTNKNDTLRCRALIKLAVYYIENDYDSTLYYSEKLLSEAKKSNILKYVITGHNFIGIAYRSKVMLSQSTEHFQTALQLGKEHQMKDREMFTRLDLGNVYTLQKLYDKSASCLQEGLEIARELQDTMMMVNFYTNMALNLSEQGLTDSVYQMQKKCLAMLGNQFQTDQNYFDLINNLSVTCITLGKYQEALEYSLKVLEFGKQNGSASYIFYGSNNAATSLIHLGEYSKAVPHLDEAERQIEILKDLKISTNLYANRILLMNKTGNYANAYPTIEKFIKLKDSLYQLNYHKDIAEVETRYEVKDKEAQILRQEASLFKQKITIFGILATFLVLALLAISYYNRYRLKQKAIMDAAIIREQELGLNAVIQAQEQERKRIARDLHDGIAQELVAIKMGMDALGHQFYSDHPDRAAKLSQLNKLLAEACNEVRNISHTMLPPALENNGLEEALRMLLRNSLDPVGIPYEMDTHPIDGSLDQVQQMGIYRIVQELINNIIKHAQASKVGLQMYRLKDQLVLRLEDNGKGFDFNKAKANSSMGMLNILSRVRNLGATFMSEPIPEGGTLSVLRIKI